MKRRVPIWMIFSVFSVLILISGLLYANIDKYNFKFEEQTYCGDIAVCNDLSIEFGAEDLYAEYKSIISIKDPLSWKNTVKPLFYAKGDSFGRWDSGFRD